MPGQTKPFGFWKKNASQTNSNSRNPYVEKRQLAPQRSASAIAGRYTVPDTQESLSFPRLAFLDEIPPDTEQLPGMPAGLPRKLDDSRTYSFPFDSVPSYDELQAENSMSGAWNSAHAADRGSVESMPDRGTLESTVDAVDTKRSSLAAASLRLSGRTMREDADSVVEQGVGNLPSQVSDHPAVETVRRPVMKDEGRHEPRNERSEGGAQDGLSERRGEERDFSERLYRKFLEHFPQVNGFAADQQADRSKALWLIGEASQESTLLVARLQGQIAQADVELRRQKKKHKSEISTQTHRIETLRQQETDLKVKLATVEKELERYAGVDQADVESQLIEKDRELMDVKSALNKAMYEKDSNAARQQSQIEELKQELTRRTDAASKARKENEELSQQIHQMAKDSDNMAQKSQKDRQDLNQQHKREAQEIEERWVMKLQQLRQRNDEHVARMREAHKAELSKITANATQVKKELETAHNTAMSESHQKHQEQTSSLVASHNNELSETSQKHQKQLEKLTEELKSSRDKVVREASNNKQKLSQLEAEYSQSRADSLRRHESEKTKLAQAAAYAADQALRKLEKLKADHEDQMNELKKTIGITKVDLMQKQKAREEKRTSLHEQQMQHIREEVEDFNEVLRTRDEEPGQTELFSTSCLPRLTDEEICHQFQHIRTKVDSLSGLEWRKQQQSWTLAVFQKLGERAPEPQLRKAVVQDLIWTQLYHFVFSSPFRIFGVKGKTLEDEWNNGRSRGPSGSGSQFNWPEASVRTELWRAFTVKGCRDVLSQPLSQHDQRAALKRGFKETLDSLIKALKEELDSVVELTEAEPDLIPKLCKQAATTWMQFAMCQSRIVVSLTGEQVKSIPEKVAQVQKGSLALTTLPKISRYGTVSGVELSKCATVVGCDGDCRTIP